MSAPRILSLTGLLVALACSLAACGSSDSDGGSAAVPATTPGYVSGNPLSKLPATAGDKPACNFITIRQVQELLPKTARGRGIPTTCTFTDAASDPFPSLGFVYVSKQLITSNIEAGKEKNQTVRQAWDSQLKSAKKLDDYVTVKGIGDSAYAQIDKGAVALRWFVKDHAYYLTYNWDTRVPSQKKLVSLKQLVKFAKDKVPSDPSKVPDTAATADQSATVSTTTPAN